MLSWTSKKRKRGVRSSVAAEARSMEQSQMTTVEFSLGDYQGAFKQQPALW